jgi:hypothetical protein
VLDDQGVGLRVPVGARIFILHVVQTGSGTHSVSYPMCNGLEADHSPPTSAEVKKT